VVDFYTLFMLIHEMDASGLILNDSCRNEQAGEILKRFTREIDTVRGQLRMGESIAADQSLFRDYLLTVQGNTDSLVTRRRRAEILRDVLKGLFEEKDARRSFTREQRRLIWHSDDRKKCTACGHALTWENFTIDHTVAHVRGGRTQIANAALMCRGCNSRKGAR
jgi:hypothetical protein